MISSKNELFNRVKNILNPNRSIATSMTSSDLLSLVLILMISLFAIGSFRLVKAEDSAKQKAIAELPIDLLDQKVSINSTKAFTLHEIINLLNKSNNLKISVHESLSKLSGTQKQRSFLIAKDMALKDVLTWINLTLGIDYAVINNKIVFCSPNLKDTIDTNYYLESFSLENLLAIENKDLKKEKDDFSNQLNLNDIKELIIDGISRDTWDDAKGRSIEIFSNKLLVKHNKATLKKIKQWLTELEYSIKEANDPNFIPTFNKPETLIEKSIQTSLKKIVSYKFQSKQFKEILEEISKSNNISFSLILDSIESFEKLNHEKISFEIKGQPLDKVLNDLLAKYSLDYQILNGTFFISSDSFFEKRLTLERYNTKIICQKESITSDVLKDLILNNLNKSSWDYDEKGTSIFAAGGQLLVTQNKKTHELISEFLKGLMSGKVNIKLSDKPK